MPEEIKTITKKEYFAIKFSMYGRPCKRWSELDANPCDDILEGMQAIIGIDAKTKSANFTSVFQYQRAKEIAEQYVKKYRGKNEKESERQNV